MSQKVRHPPVELVQIILCDLSLVTPVLSTKIKEDQKDAMLSPLQQQPAAFPHCSHSLIA